MDRLESEIAKLEVQLTELTAQLETPATYESPGRASQINRAMVQIQERLAELNPEWESEAGKLAALA